MPTPLRTRGGSRSSHCQATEESVRSRSAAKQRARMKLAVAQEQRAITGFDDLNDRDAAQWLRPSEFVTSALRGRVDEQEARRVPDRAPSLRDSFSWPKHRARSLPRPAS